MSLSSRRAWIEIRWLLKRESLSASLSSRRAWIEIESFAWSSIPRPRRSPHGGRGLKLWKTLSDIWQDKSLSSRRAWIEIIGTITSGSGVYVALLTEGVD